MQDGIDMDNAMEAAPALPRVSVLMATYNGAALVAETLRSVLAQSFADFEVVVVDDGSSDGTLNVLRGFNDSRVRILSTPRNMGPPGARNFGYAHCCGRYVAPIDQDDIWLPFRLARQVAYLDLHQDTALVATASERLVDGVRLPSPEPRCTTPGFLRWAMLVSNPLVWSSVLIRREAIDEAGVFNREDRQFAEDFDLYHRLGRVGAVARIDEVLTLYRSHAAGASRVFSDKMMASAIRVLQDAYEPILGNGAARSAQVMARHVGGHAAAPDVVTLRVIEAVLQAMTQHVKGSYALDEVARGVMATERALTMQRMVRTALRSGTVSVMALRREGLLTLAGLSQRALIRDALLGLLRGAEQRRPARVGRPAARRVTPVKVAATA